MSENKNNDSIQKGRKKVFSVVESLEVMNPNGESDGVLDVGDLIYVAQSYKVQGKDAFRFRVMDFEGTKNASTIYSAEKKYFKPYYEEATNKVAEDVEAENKKPNMIVPTITAFAGGFIAYKLAEKYMKNKAIYTLGGLGIGIAVGVFLLKYGKNKKDKK